MTAIKRPVLRAVDFWRARTDILSPRSFTRRNHSEESSEKKCKWRSARRAVPFLATAAVSIFGASLASAVDFKIISPDGGRPALAISGEILIGDTTRALPWLIRLSEDNVAPRLFLNSPGGNVLEATIFANLIHKAAMPVYVQAGDMCASACFLLFAASPSRHASPEAMIGVHSASIDGDENAGSWMLDTAMAREARAFGVPPDVIGRMVTTEPSDMAWLTSDELHEMDVRPIGATESETTSPSPASVFDPPKVAVAKPSVVESQAAPPAGGADEPWDGITYRPAQFPAGGNTTDPGSPLETEQPTAPVITVHNVDDTPDYVAHGELTATVPAYIPGR